MSCQGGNHPADSFMIDDVVSCRIASLGRIEKYDAVFCYIFYLLSGFYRHLFFSEVSIPACGDQVPAAAAPKPDEEEEEPDCD